MKPAFDFKTKEKWARDLTLDEIRWNIKDAREAERAFPDGENASYYLDEIHVLVAELNRRSGKGKP